MFTFSKQHKLFVILSAIFISCIIVSEVIGVKIFSLEDTLGIDKFRFSLFGETNLSINLSVGVLPWPLIFILTDIINDYFGYKMVRFISILSMLLISAAFFFFHFSILLPPDTGWWLSSSKEQGVDNMQQAYQATLGQGMNIIIASIIAFIIGQLVDGLIFKAIKRRMGRQMLVVRAVASTLVSQFLDSFIVIFIAFYVFKGMSFGGVMALCIVSYTYKFCMAIISSPLIEVVNYCIERYLGKEKAEAMRQASL